MPCSITKTLQAVASVQHTTAIRLPLELSMLAWTRSTPIHSVQYQRWSMEQLHLFCEQTRTAYTISFWWIWLACSGYRLWALAMSVTVRRPTESRSRKLPIRSCVATGENREVRSGISRSNTLNALYEVTRVTRIDHSHTQGDSMANESAIDRVYESIRRSKSECELTDYSCLVHHVLHQ